MSHRVATFLFVLFLSSVHVEKNKRDDFNAKRGIFVNCVKNVLRIRFTVRKLAGNTLRKFSSLERGKKLFSYFFTRVCVYTRVVISTGLKTGLLYRFLFVTFSRYGILRIEFFSFFFFQIETLILKERKKKRTYVTMGINRDNFMYDFYYRGLINSMFSN